MEINFSNKLVIYFRWIFKHSSVKMQLTQKVHEHKHLRCMIHKNNIGMFYLAQSYILLKFQVLNRSWAEAFLKITNEYNNDILIMFTKNNWKNKLSIFCSSFFSKWQWAEYIIIINHKKNFLVVQRTK